MMKFFSSTVIFGALILLFSCTKQKGIITYASSQIPINHPVTCNTPSAVSYSTSIRPLLMTNCQACHLSPSNFACDSYGSTKASAQSGFLMQYISNTDPSNTMMPPPPSRHLDSCELKALNLWIAQGCQNN